MDEIGKLIEALTKLLWPMLVLFLIIISRNEVKNIFESAKQREFIIEIGGQKLTMKEVTDQQKELFSELLERVNILEEVSSLPIKPETISDLSSSKINHFNSTDQTILEPVKKNLSVLWIDEGISNMGYIIQILKDNEFKVDIALSSSEALRRVGSKQYDAIVSDIGRTDEDGQYYPEAGIDFLKMIREMDKQIPFIIYCTDQEVNLYKNKATQHGVTKITSAKLEVLDILTRI